MNNSIGILDYDILPSNANTLLGNADTLPSNVDTQHCNINTKSTALISIKKHTKILKSKSNKLHPKMGRAYMIVKYDGENYIIHSIIESTDIVNAEKEAETKADQLTLEHNHKKHGYSAVPIHIPGTILIMYLNLETPIYYKNTPYYATMRSTYGGDTEFRAIALWKTEKEATVFASISESMKDPKFIYTYIGGPSKV